MPKIDNSPKTQPVSISAPETYAFQRAEGWYLLELKDDNDARRNAEINPGTLKVTTKIGRQVWTQKHSNHANPSPRPL